MHLDLISKDVRCTSVGAMGLVGCVRLCFATTPQSTSPPFMRLPSAHHPCLDLMRGVVVEV